MADIAQDSITDIPTQISEQSENPHIMFEPFGTAIKADEIRDRLSVSLYKQLSESSDDTTLRAVLRAQIHAGAIFRFLNVSFDLDDKVVREIVLLYTVYELHIALGHEEAGREYRILAKNLIIAAYGKFPNATDSSVPLVQVGVAVAKPKKCKRFGSYQKALERM
jgi:hypothetical protein